MRPGRLPQDDPAEQRARRTLRAKTKIIRQGEPKDTRTPPPAFPPARNTQAPPRRWT